MTAAILRAAAEYIEVRKFYIRDCEDRWGARVWAAVTEGPAYQVSEKTRWTVYHRPDVDQQWPAKLIHVASLDDAIEVGRTLAGAYRREMDALSVASEVERG